MEGLKEKLGKFFAGRREVKFAYLFGSHAKGLARGLSDIDIAVFVDEGAVGNKRYCYGLKAEIMADLMRALNTNKVDLAVLNEAGPFLSLQVIKHGRLIYCADGDARRDFWINTMRRYDDAKRLMDIQHGYMRKRIEAGRFGG